MKENWQYKKLGEVCEIYQPKTISIDMMTDDGEYYVYGANGIIGKYTNFNHEQSEVLMTCRGATCGTINVSLPFSWINGNAMVIHPKNTDIFNSQKFLVYALKSIDLSNVITGCAQPQITRQSLSPVKILVPPLSEQKRIVAELDLLSGIIEKQKQQLKELDALAQSIFYSIFGDPIDNEKGWKTIEFENCIEKIKYPNKLNTKDYFKDGNYPIISQEDSLISGYTNRMDCVFKVNTPVVIFGDHTRCFKFITFDFALGADGVKILSPIKKINSRFLYYCLILFKIPSLGYSRHYKLLKELNVPLPPIDLQNEFAEKIEKIEKQKGAINKSIEETQKLFDYTMDKYFG